MSTETFTIDMLELTKEDYERIISSLDENEKNCLPFSYSILQKIAGIINEPYSGRSELVDSIRSMASILFELSNKANQ